MVTCRMLTHYGHGSFLLLIDVRSIIIGTCIIMIEINYINKWLYDQY
jgi:general stress protein CsbA